LLNFSADFPEGDLGMAHKAEVRELFELTFHYN